ncbi:hypothetical protein OG589_43205 [Sphaerisporangium sp. NBC_01403]|uniref:hypothetical protein n=1 Tax=Sphaerisporangium sp. NBC_01403 TaxID=2903599 RepID=UPI0032496CD4
MRVTEQPPFRGPEARRIGDQAPSSGYPQGRKLPVAPRERRPALAVLAVLLIVGGALVTAVLFIQNGERVSAIAVTERVGAGQRIPVVALKEVRIAVADIQYIPWSAREEVGRHFAAVDLMPGTLLNDRMVALASSELRPGKAVVGLLLKAGQLPPGLAKGDRVQVIFIPGGQGTPESGRILAAHALVNFVDGTSVDDRPGSTGSGSTSVSVIVDTEIAPTVVAYASAGRIGLAYLPGLPADTSPQPHPSGGPSAGPSAGTPPAPDDVTTGAPSPNTRQTPRASTTPRAGTRPVRTPTSRPTAQTTGRPSTRPTARPTPTPTARRTPGPTPTTNGQG